MAIKYTFQGILIYATMAAYLLAFVATLLRQRKIGKFTYLVGFIIGCASVAFRWFDVRHVPMQNLFEIFLLFGALVYPISIFCNRVLRVGSVVADMLIGAVVLFPAGFIFNAEPQQLPPALQSWLFAPHVFVYILSYVFMAKAAVQAVSHLANRQPHDNLLSPEEATYRMVCAGFPLLTLGLILGSVWGQLAWGDWWGWDPKELWSLASWLVYVGYFHFRYMFGRRFPRFSSVWAIIGIFVIIITLLWVNLSRLFPGLHTYAM
ncbi:MAG: cytochrome c biogenesis protein CcsA [Sedimentisphaerales bacterium]|nr:cytochrome c biogenesis protein CcsA [Sedimentisphaerales bacterium]